MGARQEMMQRVLECAGQQLAGEVDGQEVRLGIDHVFFVGLPLVWGTPPFAPRVPDQSDAAAIESPPEQKPRGAAT